MFSSKEILTVAISFKAQAINAINAYIVYGHPSPFAFWGFAHTIALKLGSSLENEAVLPIVHFYKNRMERDTFNQLKSMQRDGGTKPNTQVDIPRADIECSIVFQIDCTDKNIDKQSILDAMKKMRFSGGVIHQNSVTVNIDSYEKNVLKNIRKSGFIFKEHKLKLEKGQEISSFIDELSQYKGSEKGWITPSLLGYAPVESPQKRDNIRFDYNHQFAEPLVGAVQFRKFDRFQSSIEEDSWYLDVSENLIKISNR